MTTDKKPQNFSLPDLKELESYCDLMNEKKIGIIHIETDKIKLKIVHQNNGFGLQKHQENFVNNDNPVSSENKNNDVKELDKNSTNGDIIKSPMVGTAYLSPEPTANTFIKKGDKVNKGQTLLIIEAMKVMNNINAPKDGIIVDVLIEDSQPVEYDQPIIIIKWI